MKTNIAILLVLVLIVLVVPFSSADALGTEYTYGMFSAILPEGVWYASAEQDGVIFYYDNPALDGTNNFIEFVELEEDFNSLFVSDALMTISYDSLVSNFSCVGIEETIKNEDSIIAGRKSRLFSFKMIDSDNGEFYSVFGYCVFTEDAALIVIYKSNTKDIEELRNDVLFIANSVRYLGAADNMKSNIASQADYADASDLKIGMTREEVTNIMGGNGEEKKADNGIDDLIRYKGVKIGDYGFTLECILRDNLLISKNYSTKEASLIPKTYNELRDALTDKYGKPDVEKGVLVDALGAIGSDVSEMEIDLLIISGLKFRTWKPSKKTYICLLWLPDKSFTCMIYFMPNQKQPKKKIDSNGL